MNVITYSVKHRTCGDGCCSWSETFIDVTTEDGRYVDSIDLNERKFFDVEDLKDWAERYFGEGWELEYRIDEDSCEFY